MALRNHVAGLTFFAPLALNSPRGEYTLDLRVEICSGQLYGGILDIEKNEFIVQQELQVGKHSAPVCLGRGPVNRRRTFDKVRTIRP